MSGEERESQEVRDEAGEVGEGKIGLLGHEVLLT